MRVTIKISQRHRNALRILAAKRRQRGYSAVLAQAIDEFLIHEQERSRRRAKLLSLAGSLSVEEGNEIHAIVQMSRKNRR
jgi:predicted transcriptional regulator